MKLLKFEQGEVIIDPNNTDKPIDIFIVASG
jgi:hypothetical protein